MSPFGIRAEPYRFLLNQLVQDGADPKDLAKRIGFSVTTVRHIRSGQTKRIHSETADAIASILSVRTGDGMGTK